MERSFWLIDDYLYINKNNIKSYYYDYINSDKFLLYLNYLIIYTFLIFKRVLDK